MLTFLEWRKISDAEKIFTAKGLISALGFEDDGMRQLSLMSLAYIAMGGCGHITSVADHVRQIQKNTRFLWRNGLLCPLYKLFVQCVEKKVPHDMCLQEPPKQQKTTKLDEELFNCLTILYLMVDANRMAPKFVQDLDALDPPVFEFMVQSIGRLRWNLGGDLPLRHMFLLFWKLMDCLFGDIPKLAHMKKYMRRKYDLSDSHPDAVTASPLDYHAFRQDIVQRYPSYAPPQSTIPQAMENVASMSQYIQIPRPAHAQASNAMLPEPIVHIATPAPSPPSSPAIAAGFKVKKSVFMTNQSFPFIYPTMDKDTVPQSIVEASELFAAKVYTKPDMVQLWKERELFMKQERGWDVVDENEDQDSTVDKDSEEEMILARIDKMYKGTMPQLNSFVLVLLKYFLASISFTSPEGKIDTYYRNNKRSNPRIFPHAATEIALKAISRVLENLTEWFKLSHIVKFEYLSALLFDSKYYLLVYKYFYTHDPVEAAAGSDGREKDAGFWHTAAKLSRRWRGPLPPPQLPRPAPHQTENSDAITNCSHRYFMTTINFLRVLRKITESKTQRNMILSELPVSTLRRALLVYQPEVWDLVLTLFKATVPFSGRRWRYSNMTLVSAIYLHCEQVQLRDDWLASGDTEQEMEDALPQEIAVRALIEFYNDRKRRQWSSSFEKDGNGNGSHDNVMDFFGLELEALAIERDRRRAADPSNPAAPVAETGNTPSTE